VPDHSKPTDDPTPEQPAKITPKKATPPKKGSAKPADESQGEGQEQGDGKGELVGAGAGKKSKEAAIGDDGRTPDGVRGGSKKSTTDTSDEPANGGEQGQKNPKSTKGSPGRKPKHNEPGAAEWRYKRYVKTKNAKGEEPIPFDKWKDLHFDPAAKGGRPGRGGGPAQAGARKSLESEGFKNVENVRLGDHYPDMVRPNAKGGTDYVEVGKMLKKGIPEARERTKLSNELKSLKKNDTMTFIDKNDTSRRISYNPGHSMDD
jgi:hypothetical protein